jgi:NADH:ubiquinone oxidoreductase subunit 3 (subunit A)
MSQPLESIPVAILRILQSIEMPTSEADERTVYDCLPGKHPSMAFEEFYYYRLIQFMVPDNEIVLALALSLVIRATAFSSDLMLTSNNIHRLFGTALLISLKFLFDGDQLRTNTYYAKVLGISTKELNLLEKDLLRRLDYRIQTDCTMELINEIMQYEELTYIKKITPPRAARFINDLQACRLQQKVDKPRAKL